jgi:hypothetical protein
MNEVSGALHWLQDSLSAVLQWLQKYKAGYLVVVLIAARVTWRIYRSVALRRQKVKRARVPTQPGQATFGAIQEIVRMLKSDPDTDWSTVNLTALHEHLVDMDEVMVRATVKEQPIDGGLRIEISGAGRTLAAIQRIVPAQAQELNRSGGWEATVEGRAAGVVLTVISADPKQVAHIRGLGCMGLLASTTHPGGDYLAIAKAGRPIARSSSCCVGNYRPLESGHNRIWGGEKEGNHERA